MESKYNDFLAILLFYCFLVNILPLSFFLSVRLAFFSEYWWVFCIYLLWIYYDNKSARSGSRQWSWIRTVKVFEQLLDYFPLKMEKVEGCELDPSKNYLFCGFPHGFMAFGVVFSFCFKGKFQKSFPHHEPYMTTLWQLLLAPFAREFFIRVGLVSADANVMLNLLKTPSGGVCVGVMPGGTKEGQICKPGEYKFALKNRKGFVKIALKSGASLVPCISFGELEVYKHYEYEKFKWFQDGFKKICGFAPVLCKGRGWLPYIPYKNPITVVVGNPIDVEKDEHPTPEKVDEVHSKFITEIESLFESEKHKYLEDWTNKKIEFV